MKAIQFRVARPTNRLQEVTRFYTEGLGLKIIGQFTGHEGYDGVMIGLPGSEYHLEFTQHVNKAVLPAPTKEHLLVFYFDNASAYIEANNRLQQMGCFPVEPENPYWRDKSNTYEDPDSWRVVLFNGVFA
jgi:catechol 2,3-dioxygenase-like lactoylglutathione lyase family enzyme